MFSHDSLSSSTVVCCRILRAIIHLLTDEQTNIRVSATRFVSKLPWIPATHLHNYIHPNYAIDLLFTHVISELCRAPVCCKMVASWLCDASGDVLDVLKEEVSIS